MLLCSIEESKYMFVMKWGLSKWTIPLIAGEAMIHFLMVHMGWKITVDALGKKGLIDWIEKTWKSYEAI